MTGRISVVVPVYNCGDLLPRCVSSLTAQTYGDIEIILVDDGSTDGTSAVCDELAARDSRVKVLHQTNGGVSSARNAGIAGATGDYIAFTDADDYVDPDHLSCLMELMERHGCDVAVSGFLTEKEENRTEPALGRSMNKETIHDHDSAVCELLAGGAVGGYVWNKLYRRELLDGATFRRDVKILEDLLFNFEAFGRLRTMAVTGRRSYHYIQRPTSAMHKGFGEEHRMMVETAREIRDRLSASGGELADAGVGLLGTTILWVADVMAENGPYDKALFREYKAEFKPIMGRYLRMKRIPLSYRASAVFFSMGYGVFRLAVRAVRKFM